MEFYGKKKTLHNLIDEEGNTITHHQFYEPNRIKLSPSSSSNMICLTPSPSPDSPWTISTHHTPSPHLLYHCIASLQREDGNIFAIAVSKGVVFTSSESEKIRAWRQEDCIEKGCLKAGVGEIRTILAHGNTLFTSHKDFKIRMWNFRGSSETLRSEKIATLPKRNNLFYSFLSRTTNPNFNYLQQKQEKHKDCVACMAYYHAERILYTGSWDKTVKAWKISDKKCVDTFLAHEDHVNSIVVNQEDGCVFTSSSDGCVKIWRRVYNQSSHTLTMTLKFQPSPINALALSSSMNSTYLYSGSSDGCINFWEREEISSRFNHKGFLQGHRFAILCLVAIEKLIFSGSEDTTIRVWRREENSSFHECLAVLDGHRGPVRCLAACLDAEKVVKGFLVYSASLDQSFKVWRIKVMPEENDKMQYDRSNGRIDHSKSNKNTMDLDYDMSPVLSPSWVEKKLQGDNFFY